MSAPGRNRTEDAGSTLRVAEPGTISALMAIQGAAGFGFRNPIYRAALAGEILLHETPPGARVANRLLQPERGPLLVVLGDDGDFTPGPAGFPQARRLLAWAAVVILHSTGGQEHHYQLTAEATAAERRVLLIETATARHSAWAKVIVPEILRRRRAGLKQMRVVDIGIRPGEAPHPTVSRA
ncbi:hypothetical protein [Siccirubricoccus deserti]|uniref:Uncharacterized protein n=1 Tax=Siccirubricoccus deserti TaxID=2013562 RepID=A0A9X0R550_9PROT|nr:hypothetical protein [Siccirubricoccus deserti]MBC4018723.1 hypothetical protein [Siccirubricoccus deserti]